MSTVDWGAGMAKASEYFDKQARKVEQATLRIVESLAQSHGPDFLAYLDSYGIEKFDRDVREFYDSLVLVQRRYDDATFQRWVERAFQERRDLVYPFVWHEPSQLGDLNDDFLRDLESFGDSEPVQTSY